MRIGWLSAFDYMDLYNQLQAVKLAYNTLLQSKPSSQYDSLISVIRANIGQATTLLQVASA